MTSGIPASTLTLPTRCTCLHDWHPVAGELVATVIGSGVVRGYLPSAQLVEVAVDRPHGPPTDETFPIASVQPESGHVVSCPLAMKLVAPSLSEPTTAWESTIRDSVAAIDRHDNASGQGVPVPTALPHFDFGATTKSSRGRSLEDSAICVNTVIDVVLADAPVCAVPASHRLAPLTRVTVTLRWTEGIGKRSMQRSCVRVGTLHGVDTGTPLLSVDVPGVGVVECKRDDVRDVMA